MVASNSFLLAAFLAAASLAAPIQESNIEARATATVVCKNQAFLYFPDDGRKYTASNTITGSQIDKALAAAPATQKNGDKNWGSGYPHQFQNFGNQIAVPAACSAAGAVILEFPLHQKVLHDADKGKSAQKPEGFRLLYLETKKTYCGVMSHDGLAGKAPVKEDKKKKPPVKAQPGTLGQDSVGGFHKCT
ncbi:hypothetical protein BJ875DRAFT_445557 [Amylocarpus encephaloides]|uniref:Uncharacterized protein n=1 Tax=Amylocarpus encephaloides TaxID=45428 RepID=A0A9P8C268_9HELO|nr:hypothetical protein BJ875DRAFT_445557 [Amylocarpus encephaloides]